MNHRKTPELELTEPTVRLVADAEVNQNYPQLLTTVAEAIDEVNGLAGISSFFDQDLLDQGGALSDIIASFRMPTGQVDSQLLAAALVDGGLTNDQTPVYILTSEDLAARGTNFIFGIARPDAKLSIQSIHRFVEGIGDQVLLARVVRLITHHEYAHILGLDEKTIVNQDKREGIYKGHCANECTMAQVASVSEATQRALDLEHKPNSGFCSDCVAYLKSLS